MVSTVTHFVVVKLPQDHPHIHGEHPNVPVVFFNFVGSPPYTWGALFGGFDTLSKVGITPIYMGSTVRCDYFPIWSEDHPHIHGEHANCVPPVRWPVGSPPYTWGAHIHIPSTSILYRITPIYMGSTNTLCQRTAHDGDHPHIHGEH